MCLFLAWFQGPKIRSRPGKPNQRKGQNEKFMNFAHFCEFWCFFLRKQARFTLNFCSGMPPGKVHELAFLWFGLPGPLLTKLNRNFYFCNLSGTPRISGQKSRDLVVRIARPTSLAIWHRGSSHRRPNRSRSPNRRHVASLDLKKHPDFSHRRPTSQVFRRLLFWHFPVISDQANVFSHR